MCFATLYAKLPVNLRLAAVAMDSGNLRPQTITLSEVTCSTPQGNELFAKGRYAEALSFYNRAIAIKPMFAEVYNRKGNFSYQLALALMK